MSSSLPVVGRNREVAILRQALHSTLSGEGAVAIISGQAGIGKTTLAEQLCIEARERGALALAGRCYDLTETAPFAPWIEIFSRYSTDGALPTVPENVARLGIDGVASGQSALFASIQSFLAEVAELHPVVLVLDDQHWADDASLDLLRFLARQAASLPLLILVTYRADELDPNHHFAQIVPLLVREARALRLNLQPLTIDDLWSIIRPRYQLDAGNEARLTSYLYERTEGNPFFAGELLQALEEEGVLRQAEDKWILGDLGKARTPVLIEHIVGGRLGQLSDDDQLLLSVAAVLGQEVQLARWTEVAEVGLETILEVLDRARQARLMSETLDGRGASFAHALVRQVIYERLPPTRRRIWHQRAGTVLSAEAQPDPDAIGNHFRRSGDPRAAEWLIRAGGRAQRAYSWQAAAERFEAALATMDESGEDPDKQGWLLIRIARMRRYSAPEDGLAQLEEAGRIAEETEDRPLAATVLWQEGLLRCLNGDIKRGLEQLERGVTALGALSQGDLDRLLALEPITGFFPDVTQDRGTLAMWLAGAGRYTEAIDYATPYISDSTVPAGAEGTYGDAFTALARAHAMMGDNEASRATYARGRSAYSDGRHDIHLARAMTNELQMRVLQYETDNLNERRRLQAEAESAWKRGSGAFSEGFSGAMRLPLNYIEGRWAEVRSTALELRAQGTSTLRAEAAFCLGPVVSAQGDGELLKELVEEWLPAGPAATPGDTAYHTALRMQRLAAEHAIDRGDLASALRWLQARDHWLAWSGISLGRAATALGWARYYRAADDLAEARRHAEEALQLASKPRQPLILIGATRMVGELDIAEQQYDDACTHLDASLTLADACAAPYERARTLLALAELDLARDEIHSATVRLDAARETFELLEAAPSLARVDALAAQIDAADASEAPIGVPADSAPAIPSGSEQEILDKLSAREVDVLRLLPVGRTNQEIADLLFLSPKTVENHIGRILAKTSLPNRAAAAAFAQRAGLS